MKLYLIHVEEIKNSQFQITFRQYPNWFEKMFGEKEKDLVFRGSELMWYEYPYYRVCDVDQSISLRQIEMQYKNDLFEIGKSLEMTRKK